MGVGRCHDWDEKDLSMFSHIGEVATSQSVGFRSANMEYFLHSEFVVSIVPNLDNKGKKAC